MAGELIGKVAFVSGSGRGLGRRVAEKLARMGADVAIHDLDWTAPAKYGEADDLGVVVKQLEEFGTRIVAVSGNIGDPDAVAKMRQDIESTLGPVDILVNVAGGDIGASGGKPVPNNALDIPLEDVQALTNNNLIGTIVMCKTFVVPMRERGSGTVVNFSSVAAHFGVSNGAIYAILKAAVSHYTRCLAKELQEDGVRVNCVSPGPSKTARFQATRTVDPKKMDSNKRSLRPLCRAGRDRGCGRVPVQPAVALRQRPGAVRRRRPDALPRLIRRTNQTKRAWRCMPPGPFAFPLRQSGNFRSAAYPRGRSAQGWTVEVTGSPLASACSMQRVRYWSCAPSAKG